jgi:predicted P-loop ATPase
MSEKLIIIDDEFGGKSKKEATKFKELSSKDKITHRKAYGRHSQDFKRLAVLGGTSNSLEIINDPTGNRRILPIYVNNINIQEFKNIDKTELWMEMYNTWKKYGNDCWMLTKTDIELLNEISNKYTEISMEEDVLLQCFEHTDSNDMMGVFMTATQMISVCEEKLNKQKLYHRKFGQILKKLGFKKIYKNKFRQFGYYVKKIYLE